MTKKLLTSILTVVLSFTFFSALTTQTQAANGGYDYKKALQFAQKNWNSGKGLCAEFVSDCLKAGGVTDVYNAMADGLYHDIVDSKIGKSYKLKLTSGSTKYVTKADNGDILQAGDPIFFYCKTCKKHTHVVLNNGFDAEGYAIDYAHNKAHNGKKKTCTYTHGDCGRRNWDLYVIRMDNENMLYGKKTEISAPTLKAAKNTDNGVVVSWNKVSGAQSYKVYRKTAGESWVALGKTKAASFTDTTAKNGVSYTYTVRALNGKTASQYYGGISCLALTSPEFTSVTSNGKGIKLQWTENSAADGYYLYRRINKEPWQKYKKLSGSEVTAYLDTAVKEGTVYSYRILAFNGTVRGGYDAAGVTGQLVKAPRLKALANHIDGVKISWGAVNGADTYRIYRRSDDNKKWLLLDEIKGTAFIDENAVSGKAYKYTVRADGKYNRGAYDSKGIAGLFLDAPQFEAVSSEEGINLSWNKIAGAKGYYIYEKTDDNSSWKRISNVKNADEFVQEQVELHEDYTYTIRAYNGKSKSSYLKDGVSCTYGSHLKAEATETIL